LGYYNYYSNYKEKQLKQNNNRYMDIKIEPILSRFNSENIVDEPKFNPGNVPEGVEATTENMDNMVDNMQVNMVDNKQVNNKANEDIEVDLVNIHPNITDNIDKINQIDKNNLKPKANLSKKSFNSRSSRNSRNNLGSKLKKSNSNLERVDKNSDNYENKLSNISGVKSEDENDLVFYSLDEIVENESKDLINPEDEVKANKSYADHKGVKYINNKQNSPKKTDTNHNQNDNNLRNDIIPNNILDFSYNDNKNNKNVDNNNNNNTNNNNSNNNNVDNKYRPHNLTNIFNIEYVISPPHHLQNMGSMEMNYDQKSFDNSHSDIPSSRKQRIPLKRHTTQVLRNLSYDFNLRRSIDSFKDFNNFTSFTFNNNKQNKEIFQRSKTRLSTTLHNKMDSSYNIFRKSVNIPIPRKRHNSVILRTFDRNFKSSFTSSARDYASLHDKIEHPFITRKSVVIPKHQRHSSLVLRSFDNNRLKSIRNSMNSKIFKDDDYNYFNRKSILTSDKYSGLKKRISKNSRLSVDSYDFQNTVAFYLSGVKEDRAGNGARTGAGAGESDRNDNIDKNVKPVQNIIKTRNIINKKKIINNKSNEMTSEMKNENLSK